MVSYECYYEYTIMAQLEVLILVVVDDGLVHSFAQAVNILRKCVLILVVVDDGLVLSLNSGLCD